MKIQFFISFCNENQKKFNFSNQNFLLSNSLQSKKLRQSIMLLKIGIQCTADVSRTVDGWATKVRWYWWWVIHLFLHHQSFYSALKYVIYLNLLSCCNNLIFFYLINFNYYFVINQKTTQNFNFANILISIISFNIYLP